MRSRVIAGAAIWLAAAPVFAQSQSDVTGPRTLTPPMVMCTDVPAATLPVPKLVIKGPYATDGRSAMSSGQVVIGRSPDDGLALGQRYIAQRVNGGAKRFPRPGEGFGDIRVTGWVTITAIDEHNALADINFACSTIESGDYLEPYNEVALPSSASEPIPPDFSDRANILFGVDNRVSFGDGDLFSIDRGTVNGVVSGSRYAIYRDFHNGLPLVYMGEAVIMSVGEQTSKAVATATKDAIQPGDVAVPRRQP